MPAVIYEKKGNTGYITINRPDKMNAINAEVRQGLADAWTSVADDPDVWTVIVTGAGNKAFSAGYDLTRATRSRRLSEEERRRALERAVERYVSLREAHPTLQIWKPIIVAINGYCLGGGLELALECDIRIAAEHATFSLPEVTLGGLPSGGGMQRLPRTIPFGIALELLFTGDRIDAQRAYQLGLVNKVVPLADLIPTCEALADRLNKGARQSIRAIKQAAHKGRDMPLPQALELDHLIAASRIQRTEDSREGPEAFTDKRNAIFKGR